MPPDLFDTTLEILRFSTTFVVALFLPLFLQLLLLYVIGRYFRRLAGLVLGSIASYLDLVGTPVHELSHAIASLITLCGLESIALLIDPKLKAAPTVSKRSHFIGSFVGGVAPLFGGAFVLWLTARYTIPGFEVATIPFPQLDLESAASCGTVLRTSLDYLGQFLQAAYQHLPNLQWSDWRTFVGLYVALSVGVNIAPSDQDIKVFAGGIPLVILLGLALSAWLYLSGDAEGRFLALQQDVVPHLLQFSTVITYAFILTILGVVVFLPLGIWKRWRTK